MTNLGQRVQNTLTARDLIAHEINAPVPGLDLIEVLADALENDGAPGLGMTLDDVKHTVFTVARQRIENGD